MKLLTRHAKNKVSVLTPNGLGSITVDLRRIVAVKETPLASEFPSYTDEAKVGALENRQYVFKLSGGTALKLYGARGSAVLEAWRKF